MRSNQGQPEPLPGLVDQALVDEAEAVAAEARRRLAAAQAAEKVLGRGPVEKAAWRSVRRATAQGRFRDQEATADLDTDAVILEALERCAKAIDRATGHNLTGWHANGRDLAPLFERLEALHGVITGSAEVDDAFERWLTNDDAPVEEAARDR